VYSGRLHKRENHAEGKPEHSADGAALGNVLVSDHRDRATHDATEPGTPVACSEQIEMFGSRRTRPIVDSDVT